VWYIAEGSARRDQEGQAVDYLLFGLVAGQGKRLDYFWLSDFVSGGSPTGLLVQRDLHWRPKTLEEIAPEMLNNRQKQVED
jgi:hypothetical protein